MKSRCPPSALGENGFQDLWKPTSVDAQLPSVKWRSVHTQPMLRLLSWCLTVSHETWKLCRQLYCQGVMARKEPVRLHHRCFPHCPHVPPCPDCGLCAVESVRVDSATQADCIWGEMPKRWETLAREDNWPSEETACRWGHNLGKLFIRGNGTQHQGCVLCQLKSISRTWKLHLLHWKCLLLLLSALWSCSEPRLSEGVCQAQLQRSIPVPFNSVWRAADVLLGLGEDWVWGPPLAYILV